MHLDFEMDMENTAESIGIGTRKIQLDDGTFLELADTEVYNEPLGKYLFIGCGSVLVFPDMVCDNLHLARTCYYANTETLIPWFFFLYAPFLSSSRPVCWARLQAPY